MQDLVKVHEKLKKNPKAKNIVFVGATTEGMKTLPQSQAWLEKYKVPWINAIGTKSLKDFGVNAFPTTIVIGPDGKILWHDELKGSLEAAIEEGLKKT